MRGQAKLVTWLVAGTVGLFTIGCNAVFGLDDVSFGTGGAGGAGASASTTATSTTSEASSGETTTGSGGALCGDTDLVNVGDFGPNWESFWSAEGATFVEEQAGDQPVLHVIVNDGGTTLFNALDGAPICTEACVTFSTSLFVSSEFFLTVTLEDDENDVTARAVVHDLSAAADGTFRTVEGGGCRLSSFFTSPDRLGLAASAFGDFLLDDVELRIVDCAVDAPDCLEF